MQKELIDKANEIIGLIEKNEWAVGELEQYSQNGCYLYSKIQDCVFQPLYREMHFEPWEIRLMIHNKKQRIKALKAQLERL